MANEVPFHPLIIRNFIALPLVFLILFLVLGCAGGEEAAQERLLAVRKGEQQKTDMEKLRKDLRAFEPMIPSDTRLGSLLSTFQSAARQSFLEITHIVPQNAVAHAFVTEQAFELGIYGEYENLKRFFEALVELDRLIVVSELHLTREEGTPKEGMIIATFKLSGYAVKPSWPVILGEEEGSAFPVEPEEVLRDLRERMAVYQGLRDQKRQVLDVLRDLAAIQPQTLWYLELRQNGSDFLLIGKGPDLRPISTLYESMIALESVTEVFMGEVTGNGYQTFQIRFSYSADREREPGAASESDRDPFQPPEGMETRVKLLPDPAPKEGLTGFRLEECVLEIIAVTAAGPVAYFQGPDGEPYRAKAGDRFADGEVISVSHEKGEVLVRQHLTGDESHRDVPIRLP